MRIWMNMNDIDGYVKSGHLEGVVDFSKEEEKDFQTLLRKEYNNEELTEEEQERLKDYKSKIEDSWFPVVDYWEINFWSGANQSDLLK